MPVEGTVLSLPASLYCLLLLAAFMPASSLCQVPAHLELAWSAIAGVPSVSLCPSPPPPFPPSGARFPLVWSFCVFEAIIGRGSKGAWRAAAWLRGGGQLQLGRLRGPHGRSWGGVPWGGVGAGCSLVGVGLRLVWVLCLFAIALGWVGLTCGGVGIHDAMWM